MQKIKVKVKLIHPDAKMPFYAYEEAAAFDLYSVEDKIIQPKETEIIPTGITMEIEPGYCFKFRDRSGLGAKGITHFGGLIDSDYRGEFKIILHNTTDSPYKIEKGDRIIQVVPTSVPKAEFEQVNELSQTQRGTSGFHSTGRNDNNPIQNSYEPPSKDDPLEKSETKELSCAKLPDYSNDSENNLDIQGVVGGSKITSDKRFSTESSKDTEIIIISGVAENNVIGTKNKLPWHISEDLKRFKELTWGNPVIMGRATYLSILDYLGKPLPGRTNIVLTDSPSDNAEGFIMCNSIDEALKKAKQYGNKIDIMGGASIYKQMLPLATKLEITHIHKDFEGDVYFPEIDKTIWQETKREDKKGRHFDFSFVTYEKTTTPKLETHIALVIMNENNEILFIKRSLTKKTLPGIWSFASGTLEEGESPYDTAVREANEELGVAIESKRIIATKILPEFSVKLDFMLCKIKYGFPTIKAPDEIDKLEWMTFQDFFNRFSDNEIGHGLIWLRKNPDIWRGL